METAPYKEAAVRPPALYLTNHLSETDKACWILLKEQELISNVLLCKPTHGHANVGRSARTYIDQLCEDAGYGAEEPPGAMSDREGWREIVRDIRAACAI